MGGLVADPVAFRVRGGPCAARTACKTTVEVAVTWLRHCDLGWGSHRCLSSAASRPVEAASIAHEMVHRTDTSVSMLPNFPFLPRTIRAFNGRPRPLLTWHLSIYCILTLCVCTLLHQKRSRKWSWWKLHRVVDCCPAAFTSRGLRGVTSRFARSGRHPAQQKTSNQLDPVGAMHIWRRAVLLLWLCTAHAARAQSTSTLHAATLRHTGCRDTEPWRVSEAVQAENVFRPVVRQLEPYSSCAMLAMRKLCGGSGIAQARERIIELCPVSCGGCDEKANHARRHSAYSHAHYPAHARRRASTTICFDQLSLLPTGYKGLVNGNRYTGIIANDCTVVEDSPEDRCSFRYVQSIRRACMPVWVHRMLSATSSETLHRETCSQPCR